MDEPVTVRDVMNRSYVGVSEADPVSGAAELMREEAVQSAVVLRGTEPVGVIDQDRLLELVADHRDPAETTAGDVMRPAVAVDADQRLEEAVGAMATDGIRTLLVEDGGDLVGSVSEHDVVTAHALFENRSRPSPTAARAEAPADTAAELDREVYSTQGVCESCGALTRDLASHNGQLLCQDCLAL